MERLIYREMVGRVVACAMVDVAFDSHAKDGGAEKQEAGALLLRGG